ncbi:methionine--tRNA ligase [Oceanibacterium hippocampi]|uniref:Methionine--tRNA ligase n=1 Tax=Oceanibacterium hippocampi TaxID=745714 RepID=A0A1Y5SAQ3_9PROT|nr:methionine--tRNA ligase [Oceanibacterium hippocampi]SLN36405.1 Methionine--tRNA ligase [Oceanibacterium hippocampi]
MTRHLITSALPYINGVKHLGNLVGSMLPGDVYARYLRQRGDEVLYICATDEHGTPAELAAREAGQSVAEYCAEQHEVQAELGRRFGLSFDHFGRSSSPQNRELTQHFGKVLSDAGLIEERVTRQIYSVADGRFLPDRYVVGTCPKCAYDRARGDQCENCTSLLDPTDLVEPRSAISGSTELEVRETRHLFLLQSKLAEKIRAWVDSHEDWPVLVSSIARKWLDEGLQDRCITRDLSWGVPVEREGMDGKVYYVWFDAPIEYIAATKEWADAEPATRDWKSWWFEADDVRYVQVMAKDNIPFHTLSFPGTIIGSGEPWKLVDFIKGFNWLTYYGGKFSTSQKRGVFMSDAIALLPADYWRYYLLANAPEGSDASFTWESFAGTVNKDLADTFGNLVNRTLRFTSARFGDAVPEGGEPGEMEAELAEALDKRLAAYDGFLAQMEFRKAMQELRAIWVLGNEYLTRAAPWVAIKEDRARAAVALRYTINLIRIAGVLAAPVIPETTAKLALALKLGEAEQGWIAGGAADALTALPAGHAFTVPEVLFAKIADEDVKAWEERFGGGE